MHLYFLTYTYIYKRLIKQPDNARSLELVLFVKGGVSFNCNDTFLVTGLENRTLKKKKNKQTK